MLQGERYSTKTDSVREYWVFPRTSIGFGSGTMDSHYFLEKAFAYGIYKLAGEQMIMLLMEIFFF